MNLSHSAATLETARPTLSFHQCVENAMGERLRASSIDTVQVNIGLKCNLACRHCHVESSPKREESMSWETMGAVLRAARRAGARTLDITGGAPEMHPRFREFVTAALAQRLTVIVRTNLTILLQPGHETLVAFYAAHPVHLVASLPCYLPNNVDRQRGRHVYRDSIEAILRLNEAGYGRDPGKPLDLVYNPAGASLPPDQGALESAYRRALHSEFGIAFNRLLTITNMPIGRFLDDLAREGKADSYQQLLLDAFNPTTVDGLMCRHQMHVGWDGTLYDCDFNFALGLSASGRGNVKDVDLDAFTRRRVVTGEHCFACTAGCGSSCGGKLT